MFQEQRALFILFILVFGGCASSESASPTRGISSNLRVLLIGDSHTTGSLSTDKRKTNSPGLRLSEYLAENPHLTLSTYGSCGAQTETWVYGKPTTCGYFEKTPAGTRSVPYPEKYNTPKLSTLLEEIKPSLVVVSIGGNFLGYQESWIKQRAAAFVTVIRNSGAKCAWVGPPSHRNYGKVSTEETQVQLQRIDSALRAAVDQECPYVSTLGFISYPPTGGDGIHYSALGEAGRPLADTWAKKSLVELKEKIPELR